MDDRLSFAVLEKKLQALPDGPAAVLSMPSWMGMWNAIGTVGVVTGLLPSLLIKFMAPAMWMVFMAKLGVWLALIGYGPGIVRGLWVMVFEFWHWRPKFVAQSDHDLAHFRELKRWLSNYPQEELEEHHHFARLSQERLTSKLGLLAGGFDKLGIIPALLALLLLLRNSGEITLETLLAIPPWQAVAGIILSIVYLLGLLAMRMRLCLQLYEAMLSGALDYKLREARSQDNGLS
jgi:hypothetical protein